MNRELLKPPAISLIPAMSLLFANCGANLGRIRIAGVRMIRIC